MVDPIRRVIIETEIRSVDGRRSGASTGGGTSSMGASRSSGGTSSMGASRASARAHADWKIQLAQRKRMVSHERKMELWRLRVREKSDALERRRIDKNVKAEQYIARLKKNSHKMWRERTQGIIKQARMQDSFEMSTRAQRIRKYVDREIQYRRDTGQAANIGGRDSGFRSGAGVNRGGQGANYFSTGIPFLDKANQVGFQAFITVMTARMVLQGATIAAGNAAGWITGRGDSPGAETKRFLDTGEVKKGGRIESVGNFFGGISEALVRTSESYLPFKPVRSISDRLLQGGYFTMNTGEASSRSIPAAQSRLFDAQERFRLTKSSLGPIEELRKLHEMQVKDERENLQLRKQVAMEEKSILLQRNSLFRAEVDARIAEKNRAIVEYGSQNVEGKKKLDFLQSYTARGGDIGRLPKDLQQLYMSSPLFAKESREDAIRNAFSSGFQGKFGTKFDTRRKRAEADLNRARRDFFQNEGDLRNIEAKIENLSFEVNYPNLAEEVKQKMDTAFADLAKALQDKIKEEINKREQDRNLGNNP